MMNRNETLTLIRKSLHEAFPETAFTVQATRSKETANGGEKKVYVRWTDGPDQHLVQQVVGIFEDRVWDATNTIVSWDSNPLAYHLLDGHAVRFNVSRFHFKRERNWLFYEGDDATPSCSFALPSATAERVQRVDQQTWEREDLLATANDVMRHQPPSTPRQRARL
ncbi:LPD29 domain-containing protein [Paraburkholderia dilworthii]|uniref:Large polyvalent protein associated domain-containing protein n=1 Tax=Paraburkholderia dilworthii TaxID=948106 RepID=A0ABW9D686_9BURK